MNEQKALVLIVAIVAIVAVFVAVNKPAATGNNLITGEVISGYASKNYVGYASSYQSLAEKQTCRNHGPWLQMRETGWTVPEAYQVLLQEEGMRNYFRDFAIDHGEIVMAAEVQIPRWQQELLLVNNLGRQEKKGTFTPLLTGLSMTYGDHGNCKFTVNQIQLKNSQRKRWFMIQYLRNN